jgi:hypothetical protein
MWHINSSKSFIYLVCLEAEELIGGLYYNYKPPEVELNFQCENKLIYYQQHNIIKQTAFISTATKLEKNGNYS